MTSDRTHEIPQHVNFALLVHGFDGQTVAAGIVQQSVDSDNLNAGT